MGSYLYLWLFLIYKFISNILCFLFSLLLLSCIFFHFLSYFSLNSALHVIFLLIFILFLFSQSCPKIIQKASVTFTNLESIFLSLLLHGMTIFKCFNLQLWSTSFHYDISAHILVLPCFENSQTRRYFYFTQSVFVHT